MRNCQFYYLACSLQFFRSAFLCECLLIFPYVLERRLKLNMWSVYVIILINNSCFRSASVWSVVFFPSTFCHVLGNLIPLKFQCFIMCPQSYRAQFDSLLLGNLTPLGIVKWSIGTCISLSLCWDQTRNPCIVFSILAEFFSGFYLWISMCFGENEYANCNSLIIRSSI